MKACELANFRTSFNINTHFQNFFHRNAVGLRAKRKEDRAQSITLKSLCKKCHPHVLEEGEKEWE